VCLSVCLSVCGASKRAKASERERESQSETKKISILRRDTYNKKEIKNRLEKLSEISSVVMKHKNTQAPTYRVSGEALNSHIQQLLKVYNSKNSSYARWMLASTPFACMSCHAQMPRTGKPLWNLDPEIVQGSPFEKAEFLFATNNYTSALELYNQIIRNYNPSVNSQLELSKSLHHKATVMVRVLRDLKTLEQSLSVDLKNKNLPQSFREYIQGWISQSRKLRQVNFFKNQKNPSLSDTLAKTSRLMNTSIRGLVSADNPNLIEYLYLSGLLYEQLQKEPINSDRIPDILFDLGRLDQGLNKEFFFALDQMYFKECIDKFSTHPTAKKCFLEYRAEMERLFTGTRGLDLPSEVQEELEKAQARVGL
jgi:tetratricopeptide (TPR) repeat protein